LADQLQAESPYFYVQDGKRAGLIVFEESDVARLPAINKPLFAKLKAEIDIKPVLNLTELPKSLRRSKNHGPWEHEHCELSLPPASNFSDARAPVLSGWEELAILFPSTEESLGGSSELSEFKV
jgi:hypothetical protein